jgi:hypothetical protein
MKRLRRPLSTFLLAVILLTAAGCTPTLRINQFAVKPKVHCTFPADVNVSWDVVGSETRSLASSPPVSDLPTNPAAKDNLFVPVEEPTGFALVAKTSRLTITETQSVEQLLGSREYSLGGSAECRGGVFVLNRMVSDDEYSRSVVVTNLVNYSGFDVNVSGPGGSSGSLSPLSHGMIDGPLVGSWTLTYRPAVPCSEGRPAGPLRDDSVPPDRMLIGVGATVSCR